VRVAHLEELAAAETDPVRAEEMAIYLEQLRALASPDGTLGANLEAIVEDVFGGRAFDRSSPGPAQD
jgi:hypothetical protein